MIKVKRLDIIYVTIQFILLTIFYIPFFSNVFQTPLIVKYAGAIVSILGFLIILIAIFQFCNDNIQSQTLHLSR